MAFRLAPKGGADWPFSDVAATFLAENEAGTSYQRPWLWWAGYGFSPRYPAWRGTFNASMSPPCRSRWSSSIVNAWLAALVFVACAPADPGESHTGSGGAVGGTGGGPSGSGGSGRSGG